MRTTRVIMAVFSSFNLIIALIISLHGISFCNALYDAYVASTGTDNPNCGATDPCGTFQIVLDNIADNEGIVISISGSNAAYASISSWTYCLFTILPSHGNVTILIDDSISSINEWWPSFDQCQFPICPDAVYAPFTVSELANLKLVNAVWPTSLGILEGSIPYCSPGGTISVKLEAQSHFTCERCTFYSGSQLEIGGASEVSLRDCTFVGATLTVGAFSFDGVQAENDMKLSLSQVYAVDLGSNQQFIEIVIHSSYSRNVYVDHATMNSSALFIRVSNEWQFSAVSNELVIEESTFMESVGTPGLRLLRIDEKSDIAVRMRGIQLGYSQYLDFDLSTNNLDYRPDIPILIESESAVVDMQNISVTTSIRCSLDVIEYHSDGRRRSLLSAILERPPDYPSTLWCNAPVPFLLNNGHTSLRNVILNGDYDTGAPVDFVLAEYYEYAASEFYEYQSYFYALYNDERGVLNVSDLTIYSGGAYGILYNLRGSAAVDNVRTEFAHNTSAFYDPYALALGHGITNSFGTLQISNSELSGFMFTALQIYGGEVAVTDTVISQAFSAVSTYVAADTFHARNVQIYEVGKWYAIDEFVRSLFSNGVYEWYNGVDDAAYLLAPVHLSADSISLIDSLFFVNDAYGSVAIESRGVFDQSHTDIDPRDLLILNCTFIATETINNSTELVMPYPGSRFLNDFYVYVDSSPQSSLRNIIRGIPAVKKTLFIAAPYQFTFADNIFYTSPANAIPTYLYIDSDSGDNCMSGNTFYNTAIFVNSGSIKSCKHPHLDIDTNSNACLRQFGHWDDAFANKTMLLSNSSLILNNPIHLVLDGVVFDNPATNTFEFRQQNSSFLIVESFIASNATTLAIPSFCTVACHQIIDHDALRIRQSLVRCDSTGNISVPSNVSSAVSLTAFESAQSFTFWSPHRLVLNNGTETQLFPGESLQIEYTIVDVYGNKVNTTFYPSNISINLVNTELSLNAFLSIDANGECKTCVSGIDLSGVTIDDANQTFVIDANAVDDVLVTDGLSIYVTLCASGFGVNQATLQCEICAKQSYTIEEGFDSCVVCPENLGNVLCPGADSVLVDYNHWLQIDPASSSALTVSDCPNGFCCQLSEGCDYLLEFDELCALNRDPLTALCGQCKNGYSELLGTANCGKCDRDHPEYFIVPFLIALLFSAYLVFFDVPNTDQKPSHTTERIRAMSKNGQLENRERLETIDVERKTIILDDFRAFVIMLFKIMLYFCQGLAAVLSGSANISGSVLNNVLPVLQIFNFEVNFGTNSSDDDAGFCVFTHLNAVTEILLNLTIPLFIVLLITVSLLVVTLARATKCKPRWCCIGRKISFVSAYLRGLLLCIGSVFAVLFKILSCREVNGVSVHFYYGSHECYDAWWLVSFCALLVVFVVWVVLDVVAFRMKENRQKRQENYLWTLISAYKPKLWWWETVLFTRRIFLSLFSIVSDSTTVLSDFLTALMCVYLMAHIWQQPFKYQRANRLESICLMVLIVVTIFVNNASLSDTDEAESLWLGAFLLVCVLIPICVLLFESVRFCRHACCSTTTTASRAFKMEKRRPTNHPLFLPDDNGDDNGDLTAPQKSNNDQHVPPKKKKAGHGQPQQKKKKKKNTVELVGTKRKAVSVK